MGGYDPMHQKDRDDFWVNSTWINVSPTK
jgi:hypothetical protein